MNNRFLLYFALALVVFMIWTEWTNLHKPKEPVEDFIESPSKKNISERDFPEAVDPDPKPVERFEKDKNRPKNERAIKISNEDLEVYISSRGGDIKKAVLLKHKESMDEGSPPISLLDTEKFYYVAQSGLAHDKDQDGRDVSGLAPNHYQDFRVVKVSQKQAVLEWKNQGITVSKVFSLNEDGYLLSVNHNVINNSNKMWTGRNYAQLKRTRGSGGSWAMPTFTGAAYYDGAYNKVSFDDISDKRLNIKTQGGWIAMMQHYFVSSWVLPENQSIRIETRETEPAGQEKRYLIRSTSQSIGIAPGQKFEFNSSIFIGPKLQSSLEKISPGLELTVDYGALTFLTKPLFWLLDNFYLLVNNWGWAIILLTILIKLIFYKLSATSYRSMARMKKFTPKIQSIRERYSDDRQKMNQAMMEMYKEEKINPLGGCWPILIQIPVFIALYWVLLESVEMRHAPFIFWIDDLSSKDPYFVLPLIMGASMFLQQKLNPTPPDPIQAKVMQMLPIIFTGFFAFFPSGLVLYWVVNNLLSIVQQWKIVKSIEAS